MKKSRKIDVLRKLVCRRAEGRDSYLHDCKEAVFSSSSPEIARSRPSSARPAGGTSSTMAMGNRQVHHHRFKNRHDKNPEDGTSSLRRNRGHSLDADAFMISQIEKSIRRCQERRWYAMKYQQRQRGTTELPFLLEERYNDDDEFLGRGVHPMGRVEYWDTARNSHRGSAAVAQQCDDMDLNQQMLRPTRLSSCNEMHAWDSPVAVQLLGASLDNLEPLCSPVPPRPTSRRETSKVETEVSNNRRTMKTKFADILEEYVLPSGPGLHMKAQGSCTSSTGSRCSSSAIPDQPKVYYTRYYVPKSVRDEEKEAEEVFPAVDEASCCSGDMSSIADESHGSRASVESIAVLYNHLFCSPDDELVGGDWLG